MNIVTHADGRVYVWSDTATPAPPPGGAFFTLTDAQRTAFVDLIKQPNRNSGLTFDGETFAALPFVESVIDFSDADNLEKALKAVLLASAAMSGKTVPQARAAFTTAWRALP